MKRALIIILLGLYVAVSAQPNFNNQSNLQNANKSLPNITRPSPTVSQLMKVEESQLDNYTGQPDITIPLFSNSIKNLNVSLALSYNSSGIRVTEQAGWVGKGWSLSTGGVISRSVVDIPDEINTAKFKGANYNIYHDFFNYPENELDRRRFVYDTQWGTQVDVDSKNDVYQFNFFGKTGRFVFSTVGGTLRPVIIGNDNNYKISVNYTTNATGNYPIEIASFVITDDSGYKYYFSEIERTEKKDVTFVYMQPGCNTPTAPADPVNIGKFISAWHLVKVEDENGVSLIDITYHSVLEKPEVQVSRMEYNARNLHTVTSASYPSCEPDMKCALKPQRIVTTPYRDIDSKKVNRITFKDKSYIQFFISTTHPEYREQKGAYLQSIGIYNGQDATAIKTFNFTYFTGGLFLQNVKTNNSEVDKYTFEYSNRNLYPEFTTEEKDIFGYPNFFPFKESIYTGVLTKITYPTKGTREFTWEPNTYSYKGDRLLTFREIFNNPDNYTVQQPTLSDNYINSPSSAPNPYIIFYVNIEQDAVIEAGTYANGTINSPMPNQLYIDPIMSHVDLTIDTSRPQLGFSVNTNEVKQVTQHFKSGYYKMHYNSLNFSLDLIKISGYAIVNVKQPKGRLNWFLYGGGIRINTVKDKENGADQIVKSYKYNLEAPGIMPADLPPFVISPNAVDPLTFSSGSLDGLDNLVREYMVGITPIFNMPGQTDFTIEYDVYEKQDELEVQLTKGSFIGYKNVFEYFYPNTGGQAYKSKTKYTYDSPIDHPSIVDDSYPYFPIVSSEYMQSNIRKIEYFDTANNPVVTEDFKYNYDTADIRKEVKKNFYFVANEGYYAGISQKVRILYTSYDRLLANTISASQYAMNCTGMPSALASSFQNMDKTLYREALSSSYTFIWDYKYKSLVTEHTKKEYFGANTLQVKDTYTYRSDNSLSTQTSLLSTGETTGTKYYYPQDSEMASEPYRSVLVAKNMIASPLKTEILKDNEIVSVKKLEYGDVILSDGLQATQFALALPEETKLYLKYIHAGKGNTLERKVTFERYDSMGNITQYRQEDGVPVSCIWGHNWTHPLAKIENIQYSDIPAQSITDIVNASDASSYSEVSLLNSLEALRAHTALANAMMLSFTYKPLLGLSTTIDPKGIKTTYFYDPFGRLKSVKDHEGKFLNEYFYNYRP